MADSLDDFFAKKDKSKKKGKSKYTSSDLLAKQEEKPKKLTKKKKEEKPVDSTPGEGEPVTEVKEKKEEEEWSEYVEEKETDYSGLRIQSIQIRDDDNTQEDKERTVTEGEEGEEGEEKSDGLQSAWAAAGAPPPPTTVEAPVQEEEGPPLPNVKSGKYVPPNMRNQSASSEVTPRAHLRRKKEAPNLQSEEDFPTLGGPAPEEMASAWGSGARFEKVKSGGRQVEDHSNRGPRLELGNKYDALRGGTD